VGLAASLSTNGLSPMYTIVKSISLQHSENNDAKVLAYGLLSSGDPNSLALGLAQRLTLQKRQDSL
jgi:hypothetical protein